MCVGYSWPRSRIPTKLLESSTVIAYLRTNGSHARFDAPDAIISQGCRSLAFAMHIGMQPDFSAVRCMYVVTMRWLCAAACSCCAEGCAWWRDRRMAQWRISSPLVAWEGLESLGVCRVRGSRYGELVEMSVMLSLQWLASIAPQIRPDFSDWTPMP
jgi:hypothetical protein